jgi:hypothetical protein
MVTTERLREMQVNEFKIIQRSMGHAGAKRISAELAEALGELIARRELDAARERASTVEETGISPRAFAKSFMGGDMLNESTANVRYPATSEEKRRGIFSHD